VSECCGLVSSRLSTHGARLTTGPQSRKRKANDSFEETSTAKALKKPPRLERPATPLTEPGSPTLSAMESEDEFLSDVTSQEDEDFDEGTQDSDDGSLGQGTGTMNRGSARVRAMLGTDNLLVRFRR
jgi:hypothetical protein